MSRKAGPTTEILIRRIRREGASAVDFDLAMQILSNSQTLSNAFLRRYISSDTFTAAASKLIYYYRSQLPSAIDILSISSGSRTLQRMNSLSDFSAYEVDWFRNINASRIEAWCQLGRDLLILYPALTTASSLTISYTSTTTAFSSYETDYNTSLNLPDEDVEIPLALAEITLLLQSRLTKPAARRLEELSQRLQLQQRGEP